LAERLKRGDVVVAAAPGDYGKPRPAIVVQRDDLGPLDSVIVCPLTSDLGQTGTVRLMVKPDAHNGLRVTSQVMVDKVTVIRKTRVARRIGTMSAEDMRRLDRSLAIVLDLVRL
jgi:mRNA interferase MazF